MFVNKKYDQKYYERPVINVKEGQGNIINKF